MSWGVIALRVVVPGVVVLGVVVPGVIVLEPKTEMNQVTSSVNNFEVAIILTPIQYTTYIRIFVSHNLVPVGSTPREDISGRES